MKKMYNIHIFQKRGKATCIPEFYIKAIHGVKNKGKYNTFATLP